MLAEHAAAALARPWDADAQVFHGNALMEAGEPEAALPCYQAALALRPLHAPTHYNLANVHLTLGQVAIAEAGYRTALRLDARHAGSHNNLGNALRAQGRLAEAAACYRQAVALSDVAGARNNLGSALIALRDPAAAIPHLEAALRLDPGHPDAANNLGGALLALDRPEEALPWFRSARSVQAEFGAAMALLSLGRFREGWAAYESRWRDPAFVADEPVRAAPLWQGEPLAGRTILLHAEQGLGDTIQFVRFAPRLRAAGARVILEVQAPLATLCVGLADAVVVAGTEPPAHDVRCPLLSLPHLLGLALADVPGAPYLAAVPSAIDVGDGLDVGIVVSGSPEHPEDDLRSIPPHVWRPVLNVSVRFHLLQPGLPDTAELAALRCHALPDMAATARLAAAMDLIVSVDTAVAHLAGALGRPVWVLLQHAADFRWLRGREDSPWYPTARLFRQVRAGDWDGVMARVAASLGALCALGPAAQPRKASAI